MYNDRKMKIKLKLDLAMRIHVGVYKQLHLVHNHNLPPYQVGSLILANCVGAHFPSYVGFGFYAEA